jgi:hypothetical protein
VQATLNVYTTVTRADGHTIKVHLDRGEGQDYRRSPGNLVTNVEKVRIDPKAGGVVKIAFARKNPPIEPPRDTKYVKHIRFRSDMLSRWWGTDIYLGAVALLPEGWAEHPNARYPVIYNHGHFPRTFGGIRDTPPDASAPEPQQRQQAGAYRFYQDWASGKMGRVIIVLIQHPTPFYDDSYAVNSENNGPYGDALWQELVPRVEKDPPAGAAELAGRGQRDRRGDQPSGARPRHARAVGGPVGRLAGRLRPGRPGRLPQTDLGQAHRGDRPRRRRILEGEL